MAQNKIVGSKVSKNYNRDAIPGVKFDTATQLGIVKDNLSPARDGRLRVWIPDFGGDEHNPRFWRTVNYASPYYGSTFQPTSSLNNTFTGTTHTYGMWAVPPDIGNYVLCTFVNGDPERGFWFACVPATLSNWMVPSIAADNKIDRNSLSDGIKSRVLPESSVPPQYLPAAEFNENIDGTVNGTFYNNAKPIHEFQANILFQQGLDRDKTRGAISSTSQRETPSHVFGISTPGRALTKDPADDPEYESKVNSGTITEDQFSVPTRKGGHTFVMDDGDASGVDQLIRLRTAGGHQLLMNDDQDIIYVGNKNGTSWVEISETGINIYTAGGFNIRAEDTINMHSDKDINFQALGSINMDGSTSVNISSAQINFGGSESLLMYGAKTNIGAGQITLSADGKLNVSSGGAMTLSGGTIDINGGSGGNSISCPTLAKNKLADTTFDDKKTKLWYSVPASVDSIATILPSHEPWPRAGTPAPLTKQAASSDCAPATGGAVSSYTLPPPNGNKLDNGKVNGQSAPWTTDTAFIDKVKTVAAAINANYVDVLACMHLETGGTFDPAITNSLGYTGLIQFGEASGARLVGTTTAALRAMDRVTQCDYVQKYFIANRLTTKAPTPRLVDLYLTILWPAAVGKPGDYVIFPAGSAQYKANPAFDPGHTVGYITVDMVAATAAQHLTSIQQALANAGASSQGVVTSGTGATVTDGQGNPVKTSTLSNTPAATGNVGITKSAGEAVVAPSCPAEYLAKTTTFSPGSGIGSDSPKFAQTQVKAMMAELGYFESQFNYSQVSSDGTRIGKYQVDASYLADAGYIKPDAIKQYGTATLSKPASWTGKDGIQSQADFFTNQVVQDTIQDTEFTNNYTALTANGGITSTDDVCTAAGMLFVAHQFRSTDKAKQWRDKGDIQDALGREGSVYYNHGRYAIDILAAGGAVQSVAQTAGLSGTNTTGINPDDVFVFSGTTGSRSNFDQLNGTFKDAVLTMAQDFKAKTGSKITITSAYRSPEDQEAIYQRWLAAGGGPNMPTAGGITTPAKPESQGGKGSPHNGGVAIDSSQCPLIARTVDLAQYGLRWGGTFTKPDAVHIQLANASQ